MIEIGNGLLCEIGCGPGDSYVQLGLHRQTGEHTTEKSPLPVNASLDGKICRLFIRTSKTSRGRHTEIGFGKLYFKDGQVCIEQAEDSEHYGGGSLVGDFVGMNVTLTAEIV